MPAPLALGRLLRDARERRGLTPQQLASETHIPLEHIDAFESGQLHAIPGGLYRRAEARAFADAVGLDAERVLAELRRALDVQARPDAIEPISFARAEALLTVTAMTPPAPAALERARPAAAVWPTRPRDPRRRWRMAAALVLGSVALLWEQSGSAPTMPADVPDLAATSMDAIEALEGVVRMADTTRHAPALSQTLFASGPQPSGPWRRGGRLEAGRLVIHSTPPGARVTVNGVGWGETPVTIRYLSFGTLRVRLVKANHRAQERSVQLSPGTPTATLRLALPPIPARRTPAPAVATGPMLMVTTTPPGARVTVNGIGWGSTPAAIRHLPAGRQVVRVVKDDYISEERIVQVAQGRSSRVAIPLKRMP